MDIPIVIKTRNRFQYLHTTLTSILQEGGYKGKIYIVDDCSDDEEHNQYLFTDNIINTKDFEYPTDKDWMEQIGFIPFPDTIQGIKNNNQIEVIKTPIQIGVRGCAQWTALKTFNDFCPKADAVIFCEDDIIVTKGWRKKLIDIYQKEKQNDIGWICAYDRHDGIDPMPAYERRHNENVQQAAKLINVPASELQELIEKYNENNNKRDGYRFYSALPEYQVPLSGTPATLIPRKAIDKIKIELAQPVDVSECAGDYAVQMMILENGMRLACCYPSIIQHIGDVSIARPDKKRRRVTKWFFDLKMTPLIDPLEGDKKGTP